MGRKSLVLLISIAFLTVAINTAQVIQKEKTSQQKKPKAEISNPQIKKRTDAGEKTKTKVKHHKRIKIIDDKEKKDIESKDN